MARRRFRWKYLYQWADNVIMNQPLPYASDIDLFTFNTLPRSEWLMATWEIVFALINYCKQKKYDVNVGLYADIVVHKNYRKQGLSQIKTFKYSKYSPPNIVLYKATDEYIDYSSAIYLKEISSVLGINTWLYHRPRDYKYNFYIIYEKLNINRKQKQRLQEMGVFIDIR